MYPVILAADDNGTLLVTCPDLPEVTTFGDDAEDAVRRAADAIEEALAARIAHHQDIPAPSLEPDLRAVTLAPLILAKVELYRAVLSHGMSKAELGRRLGWHASQIDRLFDLRHRSSIEQIDQALRTIGKRLVVSVHDAA
jgi:antitoxin HicB